MPSYTRVSALFYGVLVLLAIPERPATAQLSDADFATQKCNYTEGIGYDTTEGATKSNVESQADCCELCIQDQTTLECKAAVYSPTDKKCYLKGGLVEPKQKPGVVSCVPTQLPPTPTPAPEFNCSAPNANCASRLAATHWNPCYFLNSSLPSLLDGAAQVVKMGSRTIKVAAFEPRQNYPFHSPLWPSDTNQSSFGSLLSILQHPYYQQLFSIAALDNFVLIAYSTVGGRAGTLNHEFLRC